MKSYQSLSISIILHLSIFIFIIFLNKSNVAYIETDNIINISSVVSVQELGMPNVLKKDLLEFNNTKTEALELGKEDMILNQEKSDAVIKLKAINELKEKIAKDTYLNKIKLIRGQGKVFSESSYISLSGTNTGTEKDEYILKIQHLIRMNWEIPTWADLKNKKILLNCIFNSDGTIKNISILQSSGEKEIDDTAINAIKKAEPFPEPPYKFKDILVNEGLNFSFP